MTIQLTRERDEDHPNTTWIKSTVDGPISAKFTQVEATEVVSALVTAYQLSQLNPDTAKRHLIERILLRMGMELESLDVLPR